MPYQIKEEDGKQVVYNTETNKKEGSYDHRWQAMDRMKKLYAAEKDNEGKPLPKSKDDDEEEEK